MDFETLLKNRRSIREFQDKEVPLSVVKEIIQDTCLAPTASNRQPVRFIIIKDREQIRILSDESKKSLLDDLIQNPQLPLKEYEATLRDVHFNVFYNAPCLVLFVGPKNVHFLDVDCGLTASYFMFSATARGLGTCWIGLGRMFVTRKSWMRSEYHRIAELLPQSSLDIQRVSLRHPRDMLLIF
jgi:nitroreductase